MPILGQGALSKMRTQLDTPVRYQLELGDAIIDMNTLLEKRIKLSYLGEINCTHCGRKTKKSFSQGFCYPCFKKLPQCDVCIMSPEKCHFAAGTCRDSGWGEQHCFVPHVVYLANSSGAKVGITRGTQVPTRWIDQGAIQALPIFHVATRRQSGLIEAALREHITDRTNWRNMLKGAVEPVSLTEVRDQLFDAAADALQAVRSESGEGQVQPLKDGEVLDITYPVVQYPTKVVTHNLDKTPVAEGTLLGIKGQYLILDTGVINIRKFTAYHVELSAD